MNCPKCGNELAPNTEICEKCKEAVAQPAPSAPQKQKKGKKNLALKITAIVLAIIVFLTGGLFITDAIIFSTESKKGDFVTDFPILKQKTDLLVYDAEKFPYENYNIKVDRFKTGKVFKSSTFSGFENIINEQSNNPIFSIDFKEDGKYQITLEGIVSSRTQAVTESTTKKEEPKTIVIIVIVDNDNEKAVDKVTINSKEDDKPIESLDEYSVNLPGNAVGFDKDAYDYGLVTVGNKTIYSNFYESQGWKGLILFDEYTNKEETIAFSDICDDADVSEQGYMYFTGEKLYLDVSTKIASDTEYPEYTYGFLEYNLETKTSRKINAYQTADSKWLHMIYADDDYIYYLCDEGPGGDSYWIKHNLETGEMNEFLPNKLNLTTGYIGENDYLVNQHFIYSLDEDDGTCPVYAYDFESGSSYKLCETGIYSHYYDGRIYYISYMNQDQQQLGIYSCDLEGKNPMFEMEFYSGQSPYEFIGGCNLIYVYTNGKMFEYNLQNGEYKELDDSAVGVKELFEFDGKVYGSIYSEFEDYIDDVMGMQIFDLSNGYENRIAVTDQFIDSGLYKIKNNKLYYLTINFDTYDMELKITSLK